MFNLIRQVYGLLLVRTLKVMHNVRLRFLRMKGAEIGHDTWILYNLLKQPGADPANIKIGNKCLICDKTLLLSDDCYKSLFPHGSESQAVKKGITINDNCFIGIGAIILNGVTIGPNSIVGAGAVVTTDVKPNSCVAGNTSRYVCSLDAYAQVSKRSVIDGYKCVKENKSEFLKNYFWPRVREEQ